MMSTYSILAASMYAGLTKTAMVGGVFLLWCLCIQWIDRDGARVKTTREKWNLLVLGTGSLACSPG